MREGLRAREGVARLRGREKVRERRRSKAGEGDRRRSKAIEGDRRPVWHAPAMDQSVLNILRIASAVSAM